MFHSLTAKIKQKFLKDINYDYLFNTPASGEYICFDCETTGLNPKVHDIISIGAVLIKDNKILLSQKFERYVKPENSSGKESIKIHHLRDCDLEDAEDIDVVIEEFLTFIDSRPLIGYNLQFDIKMVNKYIKPKIGISLPNKNIEVSSMYYNQITSINPYVYVDLKFDSIMKRLALPVLPKHNALNDAIMTAMIFLKLKNSRL